MKGWSRGRWAAAIGGLVLAVGVGAIAIDRGTRDSNDFDNFHAAGEAVWERGELYLDKSTERYPPSFQVMMSPFGAFPIGVAVTLWLLASYAALAIAAWALGELAGLPPSRQGWAWFAVAPFVVGNITLGQSGPLLLAVATLGILAAARGHAARGGAWIALAGLFKVFPGALLVVPVALHRARGAILGAGLATLGIALWVGAAIGPGVALDDLWRWFQEVRVEQRPERLVEVVRGLRYNNQGLAITLVRSLSSDWSLDPALAAKGSVRVLDLPVAWVWRLYYGLAALLVVAWSTLALRTRRAPTPRDFLGLYALAVPVMLAVSPLVWTHYFLWLVPCFVYLLDHRRLLATLGVLSLAAAFSTPARALGFHMGMSLMLFVVVGARLWRETAARADQTVRPRPDATAIVTAGPDQ